jgi:hypothetical protein
MRTYILLADVDYDVLGYSLNIDAYFLGFGKFSSDKEALEHAKTLESLIEISDIENVKFYTLTIL